MQYTYTVSHTRLFCQQSYTSNRSAFSISERLTLGLSKMEISDSETVYTFEMGIYLGHGRRN